MDRLREIIDGMDHEVDRAILQIMDKHRGKDNAISRQDLMETLAMVGFDYWTGEIDPKTQQKIYNDRPVRDLISEFKMSGVPICSAGGENGGYYWPVNWDELEEFIDRQVRSRAMKFLKQESELRATGERMWGKYSPAKQTSLF